MKTRRTWTSICAPYRSHPISHNCGQLIYTTYFLACYGNGKKKRIYIVLAGSFLIQRKHRQYPIPTKFGFSGVDQSKIPTCFAELLILGQHIPQLLTTQLNASNTVTPTCIAQTTLGSRDQNELKMKISDLAHTVIALQFITMQKVRRQTQA